MCFSDSLTQNTQHPMLSRKKLWRVIVANSLAGILGSYCSLVPVISLCFKPRMRWKVRAAEFPPRRLFGFKNGSSSSFRSTAFKNDDDVRPWWIVYTSCEEKHVFVFKCNVAVFCPPRDRQFSPWLCLRDGERGGSSNTCFENLIWLLCKVTEKAVTVES